MHMQTWRNHQSMYHDKCFGIHCNILFGKYPYNLHK